VPPSDAALCKLVALPLPLLLLVGAFLGEGEAVEWGVREEAEW
jgi:hypothetical protein